MAKTHDPRPTSFDQPQESDWHRMISEAAYYRAERRGFQGGYTLDDWLEAERQVRQLISPKPQAESTKLVSVDDTIDGIAREALSEARRVEENSKPQT
jgi:Protein of unknown function (DUF2934)